MNPKIAAVTLATLVWSRLAFCGEIHDAAKKGDLEKVRALLKANPDLISSKDNYGMTPLHYAVAQHQKDTVQLLLANKVDVNAKDKAGWTPLHYAAAQGYKDVAKLLLANKAEINTTNNYSFTPLHLATDGGFKDNGQTPLSWAHDRNMTDLLHQHGGTNVLKSANE
jgi:ankyrin repeat protein